MARYLCAGLLGLREVDGFEFGEYKVMEDAFHLKQQRERALIRIREGRVRVATALLSRHQNTSVFRPAAAAGLAMIRAPRSAVRSRPSRSTAS